MPVQYLKRLLSDGTDKALVHLAAANLNELLGRRHGEVHTRAKAGQEKAVFVRTFRTDDGQYKCRAVLSDRYFPIRTLDMVTIALGLASGKINPKNDGDSAIDNAVLFDKHLSIQGCSVGMVNPDFAFDLRNPDGASCGRRRSPTPRTEPRSTTTPAEPPTPSAAGSTSRQKARSNTWSCRQPASATRKPEAAPPKCSPQQQHLKSTLPLREKTNERQSHSGLILD